MLAKTVLMAVMRKTVKCPAGLFQCKDRKECIHESKLCDHSPDCQDASDEKDCHYIPPACGM